MTNSFGLNIYDIIYHEKLLISKAAVEELNALLDPKRESGKHSDAETAAPAVEEKPKAKKAAEPKPKAKAEKVEKEAKPKAEKAAKPKAEKAAKETAPAADVSEEATDNE